MGAELAVVQIPHCPLHVLVAGELNHSRTITINIGKDDVTSLPEVVLYTSENYQLMEE